MDREEPLFFTDAGTMEITYVSLIQQIGAIKSENDHRGRMVYTPNSHSYFGQKQILLLDLPAHLSQNGCFHMGAISHCALSISSQRDVLHGIPLHPTPSFLPEWFLSA